MHDVVIEFLDATLTGPILLVVEDVHWIDDASGDLLNQLVLASVNRPWAGVITRRPEGNWTVATADHVTTIELTPLDATEIRQLALEVSSRDFTDLELELIEDRAQGNPLYVVELARALADAHSDAELPASVEQLISSRFDRLDPTTRRLIRVAPVLGNVFDVVAVTSMLGVLDATVDAHAALSATAATGAIAQQSGGTWAFNHALYRDTAYEGLPFERRRALHRLAAEIIETRAVDVATVAPVLSIHYSAAGSHQRRVEVLPPSGRVRGSPERVDRGCRGVRARPRSRPVLARCRRWCAGRRGREARRRVLRDRALRGCGPDLPQSPPLDGRPRRPRSSDVQARCRPGTTRPTHPGHSLVPARTARPFRRMSGVGRGARFGPMSRLPRPGSARQADDDGCIDSRRSALVDAERAGDPRTVALALERIHLGLVGIGEHDVDNTGQRALAALPGTRRPERHVEGLEQPRSRGVLRLAVVRGR